MHTISIKTFNELTLQELYAILKLRVDVFVVEQACAYQEVDDQDQEAVHFLLSKEDELAGYARVLFEKGHLHIGRIVLNQKHRKNGLGQQLIQATIDYCKTNHTHTDIIIAAQARLEDYYKKFGFITTSPTPYDWDGIDHVDMVLQ